MNNSYDEKSTIINPKTHPSFNIYKSKQMIFLAGPITGAPNWQEEIEQAIIKNIYNIVIVNPRCDDDPLSYEDKIKWDTHYLYYSDIILFYIPDRIEGAENKEYAQTTGFEMGEWIAKAKYIDKPIIISMSDNYHLKNYVETRIKNMRGNYIKIIDLGIDSIINCLSNVVNGVFYNDIYQ